jgi:two-component system, cell cycle sensor histidine kinase and response regulator CckA
MDPRPGKNKSILGAIEQLQVHDHLCLIYETHTELFEVVVPFIREGLRQRDRCLYIIDENSSKDILKAFGSSGVDTAKAMGSGALIFLTKQESYLKDGVFAPDRMIHFLDKSTKMAISDGFQTLRAIVEMTWVFSGEHGMDRLIEYEAKLNSFFQKNACLALCQYNRKCFPAPVIKDVIRTHRNIIFGGRLARNPFYIPPEDIIRPDSVSREVDYLLAAIMARDEVENTLIINEERYHRIADSLTDYLYTVMVKNKKAVETVHGPGCKAITGYRPEELSLDPNLWITMVPEEDRDAVRQQAERLLKHNKAETLEHRIIKKKGEERWVQNTPVPYIDDNGQLISYDGVIHDITERKIAEGSLRESEVLFRSLIDNIQDPVIILDFDGLTHFANNVAAKLVGVPVPAPGEHVAIEKYLAPESLQRALADLESVRKDGGPLISEYEIITAEEDHRWVEGVGVRISYKGRDVDLVTLRDITERKQSEEALRHAKEEWELTFDSVSDLICILDNNHIIRRMNRTMADRLGITPQEAIGRPCYEYIHETDGPPEFCPHNLLIRDGLEHTIDASLIMLGGWFTLTVSPLRNADGALVGCVQVARDITERNQAEEEKKRLQGQLLQAQKMEAIGSLAGGIAHDFNNILSTIMGFTEMSMEDDSLENIHYNLRQILGGSLRAKDLVRQILTFSRPKKQEQKIIDLKNIIEETVKLLKAALPSNITIRQVLVKGTHMISGDPSQIHQMVMNLCTNAEHAMRKKGGKLGLKLDKVTIQEGDPIAHAVLNHGAYVKLSVSDTGHGIDPDIHDKIFEPFFTTKQPGEGTGLGLSVVYGIVRDHGGFITLDSTPGKGSVFHVFLPVSSSPMDIKEKIHLGSFGGHERILFVDDEPQIVEIAKKVLSSLGYDVTVCGNPVQALKLFKKDPQRFDLVITDMIMPNMTGKDLARAVLKIRKDIPVILSTGHREAITDEEMKRYGFRYLLMKPAPLKEFATVVRRALGGTPPPSQGEK